MSEIKIHVNNVSKSYKKYKSELHRFLSWFGISWTKYSQTDILKNISFQMKSGEALGLVGVNGAGKSTLLKIITGTIKPTSGNVFVKGHVSALLELGIGFNPEMTGRQNVYLSAGVMGFHEKKIDSLVDAIKEFSELDDYFDQPLCTFSSGMQMRLAFSVATAVRPELLIVDEALSVGDSYFQHKCMTRIREYQKLGTSLLLVSHDISTIKQLCDRGILLDKGVVLKEGYADEIADYYNALIAEKENANLTIEQRREKNGWLLTKSGSNEATIIDIKLCDNETNKQLSVVRVSQLMTLKLTVQINVNIDKLVLGLMIRDLKGSSVWGTNTWRTHQVLENTLENEIIKFDLILPCNLGPGSYSFSTALCSSDTHIESNFEWIENHLVFDVINAGKSFFVGTNWLDSQIEITRENELLKMDECTENSKYAN